MSNEPKNEWDDMTFAKELGELCRKYNLIDCTFAGENEDGKMVGYHCIEKEGIGFGPKNLMASSFNAARLYQSSREKLFHLMDGR